MSYSFSECRPDNTGNVPTNKTPEDIVKAIRDEYTNGESRGSIAARYKKSWSTIKRLTADIIPVGSDDLPSWRVTELLSGWR